MAALLKTEKDKGLLHVSEHRQVSRGFVSHTHYSCEVTECPDKLITRQDFSSQPAEFLNGERATKSYCAAASFSRF
jgi:hypothetical protein